jgi:hypothetical protein
VALASKSARLAKLYRRLAMVWEKAIGSPTG